MRVTSNRPAKNGGYFHRFDADYQPPAPLPNPPVEINAGALMQAWRRNTRDAKLMECAMVLGVTLESLWFLGAAFAPEYNAFAFPMSDGDGNVCGIRLRTSAGRKLAVKGSRAGAFFPTGALNKVESQRVWICEGVTDTAAALSVGFFAMGRPSCVGQEDILLALLGQIAPREAVIVADNDERETPQGTRRPGMAGAAKLSDMLPLRHLILTPPSKDFRAMCLAGAGRQVIEAMLSNLLWNQGKKDSFNP